jgi:hypothetical protein
MAGSNSVRQAGMGAALAAATCSIAYDIAQIWEWLGLLGSAGGPNSTSTPLGIVLLLIPSLLLGPAHVAMIAALHLVVAETRKVYSLIALAFAIVYATLTGLVYFVQITFVGPRLAAGDMAGIELLRFVPYQSFLFAIDLYGYSLMCASALFAGLALRHRTDATAARWLLIATGLLIPGLALQMQLPWLIWLGACWAVTYPAAAVLLYRLFKRLPATAA